MNPLHAALLGALQGLTEVLPISSSAHLILIPEILGWPESGLTFDVALHLGTLLALLCYFWRDTLELVMQCFHSLANRGLRTPANRLPFYIIAASFPAAIAGKTLEHQIEAIFRDNPLLIASFLIGFGLLLAVADTLGTRRLRLDRMTLAAAMFIGSAQALALMPGVSRSGITITAALFLGFQRETAARFSFLLSLPIVAGAAILKVGDLVRSGVPAGDTLPLLIGIGTSALFGYLSVAFLLRFVQRSSLSPFVWYRLLVGGGLLVWLLAVK